MSYTFLDSTGTTQTADSSIVSGVIQRPIINVGSIIGDLTVVSGPGSVSGVGLFNVNPVGNGSVLVYVPGSIAVAVMNNTASVITNQGTNPWVIGSIVGTFAEDAAHTTNDKGLFVLGVRNDTLSSVTSADGDYSPMSTGPIGEAVVANSPITKWVQGQTSVMYGVSVVALVAQGASIFTYITAVQIANDSPNFSRVTFTSAQGLVGSILGTIPAPASGGAIVVLPNAWKTGANQGVSASISGISSIYVSLQGFTAKI